LHMIHPTKSLPRALQAVKRLFSDKGNPPAEVPAQESLLSEHRPKIAYPTAVRDDTPPSYDDEAMALWGRSVDFLREDRFVKAYRSGMNSGHKLRWPGTDFAIDTPWRVHLACWAATHALNFPGDFVECGVNTGILSLAVCHYIDFNSTGKAFYLFDTFCGIPEDQMTEQERPMRVPENEAFYEECYELAVHNFRPFSLAHLIRGKVPDTLAQVDIGQVCYLSLDMNIVVPEVAAIEFFWPKLSSGAPVLLDDYGFSNHAEQREGMDAFAARVGVSIATLPTGQGLLIKP
jgi:O-methyltransferase